MYYPMTKCTHKQLMTACMLAGTLMLGACTSTPPVTKEVSIVPITNHLEETNGAFVLKSNTSIGVIDAELIPAAEYLADMLSSATGYDLKVKEGEGTITLALGDVQGKEGAYTLTAESDKVNITGNSYGGVIAGIESLRQLFPPQIESKEIVKGTDWAIPAVNIQDAPRFEWRGIMLDVSRHFYTIDEVKELLDVMALYKMNKFHWHLTDDQGWRIEIEKYPRLTQIGAYRDSTQIGGWNSPLYDVNIHGGYYTREDIREIVDFAAERHIEIVPEIEMPGHTSAAIAAYPELGSLKTPPTVATYFNPTWGVFNVADERVIQFIQDVFDEIFDLFPSRYIHIGGDEVHPESWEANSDISRFMEEKNLDNYSEVQMLFTNRVASLIHSKGRTMIGWNDIMGKNIHEWADSDNESAHALAPYAIVQFWKGDTALIAEALKQGHRVINSSHRDTYLDYNHTKIPLEKAYDFSPFPKGMDRKYKPLLLGSGCQMWSEWIPRIEDMQRQVFPRIAAYAESGWTIENRKNFTRFSTSLSQVLIPRWKQKNIAWHKESTPQAE